MLIYMHVLDSQVYEMPGGCTAAHKHLQRVQSTSSGGMAYCQQLSARLDQGRLSICPWSNGRVALNFHVKAYAAFGLAGELPSGTLRTHWRKQAAINSRYTATPEAGSPANQHLLPCICCCTFGAGDVKGASLQHLPALCCELHHTHACPSQLPATTVKPQLNCLHWQILAHTWRLITSSAKVLSLSTRAISINHSWLQTTDA